MFTLSFVLAISGIEFKVNELDKNVVNLVTLYVELLSVNIRINLKK